MLCATDLPRDSQIAFRLMNHEWRNSGIAFIMYCLYYGLESLISVEIFVSSPWRWAMTHSCTRSEWVHGSRGVRWLGLNHQTDRAFSWMIGSLEICFTSYLFSRNHHATTPCWEQCLCEQYIERARDFCIIPISTRLEPPVRMVLNYCWQSHLLTWVLSTVHFVAYQSTNMFFASDAYSASAVRLLRRAESIAVSWIISWMDPLTTVLTSLVWLHRRLYILWCTLGVNCAKLFCGCHCQIKKIFRKELFAGETVLCPALPCPDRHSPPGMIVIVEYIAAPPSLNTLLLRPLSGKQGWYPILPGRVSSFSRGKDFYCGHFLFFPELCALWCSRETTGTPFWAVSDSEMSWLEE